jgi:hypothetical protein
MGIAVFETAAGKKQAALLHIGTNSAHTLVNVLPLKLLTCSRREVAIWAHWARHLHLIALFRTAVPSLHSFKIVVAVTWSCVHHACSGFHRHVLPRDYHTAKTWKNTPPPG